MEQVRCVWVAILTSVFVLPQCAGGPGGIWQIEKKLAEGA